MGVPYCIVKGKARLVCLHIINHSEILLYVYLSVGLYGLSVGLHSLSVSLYGLSVGLYGMSVSLYSLSVGLYDMSVTLYSMSVSLYSMSTVCMVCLYGLSVQYVCTVSTVCM